MPRFTVALLVLVVVLPDIKLFIENGTHGGIRTHNTMLLRHMTLPIGLHVHYKIGAKGGIRTHVV